MNMSWVRTRALLPLLLATFAVAACDDVFGFGDIGDLEEAERRWAREGPQSYSYVLERSCFCGSETTRPVRITVENRVVQSRRYVDTGADVPTQFEQYFPSMEGVFQILHDALRRNADAVDAEYDSRLGHLIQAEIDFIHNAVDDELNLYVSQLQRR